jgi:hypothetical protein
MKIEERSLKKDVNIKSKPPDFKGKPETVKKEGGNNAK